MDILSHGLWGGVAAGRQTKKRFWLAFSFGVLPDLLAFAPVFLVHLFTNGFVRPKFATYEPPRPDLLPAYVNQVYNYTHSFLIFALVFLLVWLVMRKPFMPLLAWGLHILMDIPTHSTAFFPTPFLFPVSSYVVSGIPWSTPAIFFTNWFAIILTYTYWWRKKLKADKPLYDTRVG